MEPPEDSSEVDEEESIVVKHGKGSPKVVTSAGEIVASLSVASFVQNETKVSRFILSYLDSLTALWIVMTWHPELSMHSFVWLLSTNAKTDLTAAFSSATINRSGSGLAPLGKDRQ